MVVYELYDCQAMKERWTDNLLAKIGYSRIRTKRDGAKYATKPITFFKMVLFKKSSNCCLHERRRILWHSALFVTDRPDDWAQLPQPCDPRMINKERPFSMTSHTGAVHAPLLMGSEASRGTPPFPSQLKLHGFTVPI